VPCEAGKAEVSNVLGFSSVSHRPASGHRVKIDAAFGADGGASEPIHIILAEVAVAIECCRTLVLIEDRVPDALD